MDTPETLLQTLTLERIEENLFRGFSEQKTGRLFGGQVIAQALLAAYATVADERLCHSLHCYFIRPGDATTPILLEVDRSRDGGSFTTRRVTAIQHGQQIFNFAASFQAYEEGHDFQATMPPAPPPEQCVDLEELRRKTLVDAPPEIRERWARPRPIRILVADEGDPFEPTPRAPTNLTWMRALPQIGEDRRMHQAIMAYASDMNLLSTAMRPHGLQFGMPGMQVASLDHAMWFHRPTDFNGWHLYAHDCPSTSGGRGLVRGSLYSRDGVLAATVAQEGLIRRRRPMTENAAT